VQALARAVTQLFAPDSLSLEPGVEEDGVSHGEERPGNTCKDGTRNTKSANLAPRNRDGKHPGNSKSSHFNNHGEKSLPRSSALQKGAEHVGNMKLDTPVLEPIGDGEPQPGDLILLTTAGSIYAAGRQLTGQSHDHVVVVLKRRRVLHISPPVIRTLNIDTVLRTSRAPQVMRPRLAPEERERWLTELEMLIGEKYSLMQLTRTIWRLAMLHTILPVAPSIPRGIQSLANNSNGRICTNAILSSLVRNAPPIAEAMRQLSPRVDFDPSNEASGSLEDFLVLQRTRSDLVAHVECIEVNEWCGPEQARVASWASNLSIDYVFVLQDKPNFTGPGSSRKGFGFPPSQFASVSLKRFGFAGLILEFLQKFVGVLINENDRDAINNLWLRAQLYLTSYIDVEKLRDRIAQLVVQYPALPNIAYIVGFLFALGHIKTILKIVLRAVQVALARRALLEAWKEIQRPKL